jgi:cytochrome c peroxidase
MRGQITTLDASVKRGFNLFMGKAQCGSCHFAPTYFGTAPPFYGISESEVLGVTKTFDTLHPVLDDDIGRFKNFEIDQFRNSIKTSTVRNAELTAPYMHNGGFKTLDEVIEFYNRGGGAGMGLSVPNQTLPATKLNLSKQDKKDIISFIKALTDTSGINKLIF